MIPKKATEVELADIQQLVTGQVREGKTIEYKRELKIADNTEKKEILADVSSFANTGGGDLLIGIDAKDGIPLAISPLQIANIDAEVLRVESIVRTGIDPRLSFTVHPIATGAADEYVLLLRVDESWNKPHRVTLGGSGKFYARSSAGKYDLDVEELRQVFTLSSGVEKKIEDFRAERLITIQTGGIFPPLSSENLIVVQLLPLASFSTKLVLPRDTLLALEKESMLLRPMNASGWHSPRMNLEGMFCFSGTTDENTHSYVQLFRNGAVELLDASVLDRSDGNTIPHVLYEKTVVDAVKSGMEILKKVEISPPMLVCLSLLNVRGMKMSDGRHERYGDYEHDIRQKDLILPPVLYEDYGDDVAKAMQSTLDLVWNACGIRKSQNYDKDGNFRIIG